VSQAKGAVPVLGRPVPSGISLIKANHSGKVGGGYLRSRIAQLQSGTTKFSVSFEKSELSPPIFWAVKAII
jgi:hypothetical protein